MTTVLLRSQELRAIETRHAGAKPPLMERAGRAAANLARRLTGGRGRVLVCAGPGNNGGDARVMARHLQAAGIGVAVVGAGDPIPPGDYALVVDGLFGIGLGRPLAGPYAELVERINAFAGPVLALDVPSGIDGDSGRVLGVAVRATHTLSFIGGKPGLYTLDGPDHSGEVSVDDLGLDLAGHAGALLDASGFAALLAPRPRNCHKGHFGSVAVIGGAPGMTGAALLAARAALNLGAGRVFVGLLQPLAIDPVQPELMLRSVDDALAAATVIVAGPGLGLGDAALEILRRVVGEELPLVLDADALNAIATRPVLARQLALRSSPTLLTPHPAEAARLLSSSVDAVQADRVGQAVELARRFRAHVALKGCGTVLTYPDGRWRINTTGNAGLASAGSGDVLAGIAGALLGQHWPAEAALAGAVHLHGAAADAAVAAGRGPIGLTAGELIPFARALRNPPTLHA